MPEDAALLEAGSPQTKMLRFPKALSLLLCLGIVCADRLTAQTGESEAVFASTANGYVRTRLPDGSFAPETYTLLKGGLWGVKFADPTLDRVSFDDIAEKVAGALASRNYLPSRDRQAIKLLIVVYWGRTLAPEHHSAFVPFDVTRGTPPPPWFLESGGLSRAEARQEADSVWDAATLLGYGSSQDPDLLNPRYFVVLLAYDFQAKWKQGKSTLLWQTRFSLRAQGNEFDRQLTAMVRSASPFFGQDTHGLTHHPVPEGHVRLAKLKSLGFLPEAEPARAALAPDGAHVAFLQEENNHSRLVIAEIDRPKPPVVVEVFNSRPDSTPLSWADADHVLVGRTSSTSIRFDLAGKRAEPDGATSGLSSAEALDETASASTPADLPALVDTKFPDRQVDLLGADRAQQRFLLLVSGGAGTARYFVYDRGDDLLFEVGRK